MALKSKAAEIRWATATGARQDVGEADEARICAAVRPLSARKEKEKEKKTRVLY